MNALLVLFPYVVSFMFGVAGKRWSEAVRYTGIFLVLLILFRLVTGLEAARIETNGIVGFVAYQMPTILICFAFAAMGFGLRRLIDRLKRPPPQAAEPVEHGTIPRG